MSNFPKYEPSDYIKLMSPLDPIEEYFGYSIKRGDNFYLGPMSGSKVRQCLHVVKMNYLDIKHKHNGGIVTGAGLPSPQVAIVAAVAKYFGLKCAVTVPKYDNDKKDFFRINASLAQRLGAKVYGVGNPNPAGYEKDAKDLEKELGYFRIKFGMLGTMVTWPLVYQCKNIPDYVKDIVIISGSGISALGVMRGCAIHKKKVKNIYVVTLSDYFNRNKVELFDKLPECEKFKGEFFTIPSDVPYRTEYKWNKGFDLDLTYESKAFKWMSENLKPSKKILFWVVGKKCYDLNMIQPINWNMSRHEKELRCPEIMEKFLK